VPNALGAATKVVYDYPNETVPLHLRNPSTKLKKKLGYGNNYQWSEKHVGPTIDLPFLPEKLKDRVFFEEK
jgi:putative ATPase